MMLKIREIFNGSIETSKKLKSLLYLVTTIYVTSYIIGYILVQSQMPFAMKFVEPLVNDLSANPIFVPIISALETGNLAFAIAYTFTINLSSGAFLSTTLPGTIPLLGAIASILVTGFRGLMIGAIFTYVISLEPRAAGFGWAVLALGTLILELGAYVFSATAGINISISSIFPNRYQVESRWTAFKMAWKDAGRLYIIVVILLALGAIWEMGGIYILNP